MAFVGNEKTHEELHSGDLVPRPKLGAPTQNWCPDSNSKGKLSKFRVGTLQSEPICAFRYYWFI